MTFAPKDWRKIEAQLFGQPGIAVQLLADLRAKAVTYEELFVGEVPTTLVDSVEYSAFKADLTSRNTTMRNLLIKLGSPPLKADPNVTLASEFNSLRASLEALLKKIEQANGPKLDAATRQIATLSLQKKRVDEFALDRRRVPEHYGAAGYAEVALAESIANAEAWLALQA